MEEPNFDLQTLDNWLEVELHDLPLLQQMVPELYMMVVFQCFREQFGQNLPATLRFLHAFGYLPEHLQGDFNASVAFVAHLWTDFTGNPFYQQYPLRFEQMPEQSIVFPWYVADPAMVEYFTLRLVGQEFYTALNQDLVLDLRNMCTVYLLNERLGPFQMNNARLIFRLVLYEHFCRHIRERLRIADVNFFVAVNISTRQETAQIMATPGFRESAIRHNVFSFLYDFEAIRDEDYLPTSAFITRCRNFMRNMTQVDWNPPQIDLNMFRRHRQWSINRDVPLSWDGVCPAYRQLLHKMTILSTQPVTQDLLRLFVGSMFMEPIQPPGPGMVESAQGYVQAFNQITWILALLTPTLAAWQAWLNLPNRGSQGGGRPDGGGQGGGQGGVGGRSGSVIYYRRPAGPQMPPPNTPQNQHQTGGSRFGNHRPISMEPSFAISTQANVDQLGSTSEQAGEDSLSSSASDRIGQSFTDGLKPIASGCAHDCVAQVTKSGIDAFTQNRMSVDI